MIPSFLTRDMLDGRRSTRAQRIEAAKTHRRTKMTSMPKPYKVHVSLGNFSLNERPIMRNSESCVHRLRDTTHYGEEQRKRGEKQQVTLSSITTFTYPHYLIPSWRGGEHKGIICASGLIKSPTLNELFTCKLQLGV